MPRKPLKPCNKPGCGALVEGGGYCAKHKQENQQRVDRERGSAHQRGYNARWRRYANWFLRQPENVFCKLKLKGCTNLAECVDHIIPPDSPDDPRFWDPENHQSVCIRCNSRKGNRRM